MDLSGFIENTVFMLSGTALGLYLRWRYWEKPLGEAFVSVTETILATHPHRREVVQALHAIASDKKAKKGK